MKLIVLLDITIADTNLGNVIIMSAAEKHLRKVFPHAFFVRVSSFDGLGPPAKELVREADHIFLCGANTLYSHIWLFKPWRIGIRDALLMRNKVITVGVGWMRHKRLSEFWMAPDPYTRVVYQLALSKEHHHSVRDNYAERRLSELGFMVLNTGCPSLWSLSREHCEGIPKEKGASVVTTLTCYRQDLGADRMLFNILRRSYDKVYFWAQQPKDWAYAQMVFGKDKEAVEFLPPSLEALDELLTSEASVDYVGTRLHAGIRALQRQRRTIIVGVDDRSLEMKKDFNLPVVLRGEWELLEEWVHKPLEIRVRVPEQNIRSFMEQFQERALQEEL
ncbi:MAG: polysaccharide pyruvyl transferase family protein [Candidatus Methanomethylicaceae archaeon]